MECVQVTHLFLFLFLFAQVLSFIYLLTFDCGRSAHSPLKLVDRFPDHPEIGTLHDNFVYERIFSSLCNLFIHFLLILSHYIVAVETMLSLRHSF